MNMPTFTGEFSLYGSRGHYQLVGTYTARVDTTEIVPQALCQFDAYTGELCCCDQWGCECSDVGPFHLPV
jgi:hypothetical protein